jgi:hypothetical protein
MAKNPNYDNVILGAGIAGLIVFYYLAESTKTRNILISNSLTSETNSKFPLGPRFLKVNKDTETLLRRIGLSTKTKEVFVGWQEGGEIRNYPTYAHIQDSPNFTAYEVSQTKLGQTLLNKCKEISEKSKYNNIVIDNIKSINNKKITTEKSIYYTNNIVSTIPLPSLLKVLSNASVTFKTIKEPEETSFYLIEEKEKGYFDYIYSGEHLWSRKTYIPELKSWVYEVTSKQPHYFENTLDPNTFNGRIQVKSQIKNNVNLKELGIIKLVGRYGRMNLNIRTEDVINWAYDYIKNFKKD